METNDTVVDEDIVEDIPSEDNDPVITDEASGQVEATEPTEDITPEPKYLDLSEYQDHLVRVKVGGEEVEVPASELPAGFMRHADYTRKTQEVAFWNQVDTAMRNPETAGPALQYLAQTFGVEAASAYAEQQQQEPDEDEYADPIERRLAEIEARAAKAEQYVSQQEATAHLNEVVRGLSQKYEDFDSKAVVTEAINRGISDPNALEDVYKLMQFDTLRARTAAEQTAASQRAAQDASRQAAAHGAAAVVASGGSATASSASTPSRPPQTVWEAWQAAKAEHGD